MTCAAALNVKLCRPLSRPHPISQTQTIRIVRSISTFSTYSMKELQRGVLTGMEAGSSLCYNTILTIDRNTKRVYLSFTRTKEADNLDRTRPGTCGGSPRQQVLMNCTGWPRIRKKAKRRRVTVISVALATSRLFVGRCSSRSLYNFVNSRNLVKRWLSLHGRDFTINDISPLEWVLRFVENCSLSFGC